jgi:tRNA(Ile)-lysidine synthase
MDSVSLLDAVLPLASHWSITACHVNHGLSPNADSWERFCARLCRAHGIRFYTHHAALPAGAGEEWARQARMRAFAQLPVQAVVAAHHADDQAETVLFRALRGTGPHGMGAMRACAPLPGAAHMLLLRPWLMLSRSEIAAYASHRRLRWIEDEDNRNISRRRNFLRRRALPILYEQFPDCGRTLAAAAARFAAGAELLAVLAADDEKAASTVDGGFSIAHFHNIGAARTKNWLHSSLLKSGGRFSERSIAEAVRQIMANGGNHLSFRFRNITLRAWRGRIYWDRLPSVPKNFQVSVRAVDGRCDLPQIGGTLVMRQQRGGLSVAKAGDTFTAKLRRGGERLQLSPTRERPVSDLLREAGVMPWRRQRLPLLFAGDTLAALPGIAVSEMFRASPDEEGLDCRFEWR